ncbi:alanine racemase [Butyrivibrio sp. MC2013]|uniref:alanine racemase n=1 Tax=Butyrivibrio sp. MC2013 TaxID=1280686 RepID=UPI0004285C2F|nr:alanine racemase [Butyrivibrio sp. MC2013]
MDENKNAWVEISSEALSHNIELIRTRIGSHTKLCAVIKGNAYGHGLIGVKKILSENDLSDMCAVGKISEMLRVFRKTEDDGKDVLLLGMAEACEVEAMLGKVPDRSRRAVFSVYNIRHFNELNELGIRLNIRIRVHIRVDIWDSGMGLGYGYFREHEDELFAAEGLDICGLYGHLYSAYYEDRGVTRRELEAFDELVKSIRPEHRKRLIVHVMNSSLIFSFPEYTYDMVRAGTAIYGLPCGDEGLLKPVMKVCARIFDVRKIDAATPLTYQPVDKRLGKRKIARAMIGYCDCPILLTRGDVRIMIHGRIYPQADECCMDNLCIDVTGSDDVTEGDIAVLLGESGVRAEDVVINNHMAMLHADWLCYTAERLDKVYK